MEHERWKRPIFESLRPAQGASREGCRKDKEKERGHGAGARWRKAEPETQRRTISKDNSTTKSLILAQDER